jgi:hypothetical protein
MSGPMMARMDLASSTPELFGVQVAVLALVVAAFGFGVSLCALGWQISKHVLDGGRVKVYLNPAIWEPDLTLATNRNGKWPMEKRHLVHVRVRPDNFEVAQLVIENPGRTAVTVYTPSLAVYGTGKHAYAVTPRMYKLDSFGPDNTNAENVVRINPYDRVTFLMDYWETCPLLLKEAGKSGIRLRGKVSVAGRTRPSKSKRRLAWHIPQGAWTARTDLEKLSPRTVMWRELYRQNANTPVSDEEERRKRKGLEGRILTRAMLAFQERPPIDYFAEELRRCAEHFGADEGSFESYAWQIYEALDKHEKHLEGWPTRHSGRPDSPSHNAAQ